MADGPYETVLEELGDLLDAGVLKPDQNNTCLIKMVSGLEVFVEIERKTGEFLLLSANLGDPGPGAYRENLFEAAMKSNGGEHPLHGILAFSDVTNQLMIFERIPMKDITGDRVMERLTPFEEKAIIWLEAIKNNEVPIVESVHTTRRMGGMFGL